MFFVEKVGEDDGLLLLPIEVHEVIFVSKIISK